MPSDECRVLRFSTSAGVGVRPRVQASSSASGDVAGESVRAEASRPHYP